MCFCAPSNQEIPYTGSSLHIGVALRQLTVFYLQVHDGKTGVDVFLGGGIALMALLRLLASRSRTNTQLICSCQEYLTYCTVLLLIIIVSFTHLPIIICVIILRYKCLLLFFV